MALYTRSQAVVLLIVAGVAGAGLAIGQWRRTHPDLAERLERLDRAAPAAETPPAPVADVPRPPPPERAARRPPPAKSAARERRVDVNRATEEELIGLPGIGPVLAARIVQTRERDGPFASLDDLGRVRGLGRTKRERLAPAIALPP